MALRRVPVPIIGPSSKARSGAQQSGRTVNLYPIINDPDAKAVVALHHVPGNLVVIDISERFGGAATSIRGFHRMGERLFKVANEKIFEAIDLDNNTLTEWASLTTFSNRVGMSDNSGILIVGDDTGFYGLNTANGSLTQVLNEGEEPILGWDSGWVDGYTIYVARNSSRFHYSAINDPLTVNGLDYATAEGDPDVIKKLIVSNRELVFLGGKSVEFWRNTGGADNAFERIIGGFQPYGCACRHSAVEFNGTVVFVGRHQHGEGQVVRLGSAGVRPVRMSNAAVEAALAGVLQDGLQEQVTAFTYEDNGHSFYVLNLPATPGLPNGNRKGQPSQTWVFDDTTTMWHERAHLNPRTGLLERAKADHHVLWRDPRGQGKHLTSRYDDAAIYWQNLDFYRDNVDPLLKERESAGPLNMDGRDFAVKKLIVEMEVGVGRDGGVQGSDPILMMHYRWGLGAWSDQVDRHIGKIGEGKTTIEFGPCGRGRDFSVRLAVSDPVRVVFTGAWADVEVGR